MSTENTSPSPDAPRYFLSPYFFMTRAFCYFELNKLPSHWLHLDTLSALWWTRISLLLSGVLEQWSSWEPLRTKNWFWNCKPLPSKCSRHKGRKRCKSNSDSMDPGSSYSPSAFAIEPPGLAFGANRWNLGDISLESCSLHALDCNLEGNLGPTISDFLLFHWYERLLSWNLLCMVLFLKELGIELFRLCRLLL